MDTLIEQQIAAVGHANVLVALRPEAMGAARAGERELLAAASSVRGSLERYFVERDPAQAVALELASAHFAGRPPRPEATKHPTVRIYPHLGLALGFVDADGVGALARDPLVESVHAAALEVSLIRPVKAKPARLTAAPSWGIERLNVPKLWACGIVGMGVVVGHLDTGVDGSHPVLNGAIAGFAEFDMAGNEVPGAKAHDSGEHGTHTAGTIVGRPGSKGASGVAPGALLASAMVIEGGQVNARILAGLEWIVSQKVRILSMSLGLRGYTPAFEALIDALRRNNILPTIAIGNEGPDTSRSAGNYTNVLSVGACAADDTVADFSSSQRFARQDDPFVPDLVAPGVDVLSCIPNGRFARMDGTSMATPHVAGLAALLLQEKPDANAAELETAILTSCRLPATMPEYRANRGVPDAVQALKLLTGRDLAAEASASAALHRTASSRRAHRPRKVV
jgi:subtilisin